MPFAGMTPFFWVTGQAQRPAQHPRPEAERLVTACIHRRSIPTQRCRGKKVGLAFPYAAVHTGCRREVCWASFF